MTTWTNARPRSCHPVSTTPHVSTHLAVSSVPAHQAQWAPSARKRWTTVRATRALPRNQSPARASLLRALSRAFASRVSRVCAARLRSTIVATRVRAYRVNSSGVSTTSGATSACVDRATQARIVRSKRMSALPRRAPMAPRVSIKSTVTIACVLLASAVNVAL
jgi:hypothetical protein